jgi:hypothetical protein
MNVHTKAGGEDPLVVTQFYYSQTFPYLMMKHHAEAVRTPTDSLLDRHRLGLNVSA